MGTARWPDKEGDWTLSRAERSQIGRKVMSQREGCLSIESRGVYTNLRREASEAMTREDEVEGPR